MTQVTLDVYRRLDNRLEGLSDDSPRALELHELRKHALHSDFDGQSEVVVDWGQTNDSESHELVTLVLGAAGAAIFTGVVIPAVTYIGQKLAEKAVDEGASRLVKWVASKLVPQQRAKRLLDFTVTTPDGTRVQCDFSNQKGVVSIWFGDGSSATMEFDATGNGA